MFEATRAPPKAPSLSTLELDDDQKAGMADMATLQHTRAPVGYERRTVPQMRDEVCIYV